MCSPPPISGPASPKPIIGIVGGIAAGKSTVARAFADLGCAVIDADALAHEALDRPETVRAVADHWGDDLVDASGRIRRAELGRRVFAEPRALAALTRLIHPAVLADVESLIARHRADADVPAIVLDMPLLFEVGWQERCDRIVFVDCPAELRVARFRQKFGLEEADLRQREKLQICLDTKRARADTTLCSKSDFETVVKQVTEIFTDILN